MPNKRKNIKNYTPELKYIVPVVVKETNSIRKYFVQSVNADRAISKFCLCKRGVWVHAPKSVYDDIQNAIVDGEKSGMVVGWQTKIEYENWRYSNEEVLSSK